MIILCKNLIKDILSQIKTIVQTTLNSTEIEYRKQLANQLYINGYDYFNGEKSTEAARVIKILALAINDSLVEKFDIHRLQTDNSDKFDQAVEDLGDQLNVEGSVKDSLLKETNWSSLAKAKCPLAFAEFLKKNGSEVFVRRLIEHQYEIKWATNGEGGRPEPFNFYDFCDKEQSLKYLQYKQRTAHTKVTLYQECFNNSPQFSKIELCPDVYMKTTDKGWQKQPAGRENNNDLAWMTDKSIHNFLNTEADEIKFEDLTASLEKNMVYLAVVEDTDFESRKELKLCEISKYQGYVGKATNGILGRWLNDGGSHCEKMKKCLDNVNAMTNYNPIRLEGIQLVDVRLALAKVRKENCALFVMKTFDDEEEKAAELSWNNAKKEFENAKKSFTGTEDRKYSKQTLDDLEKKSEEAKKRYYTARTEILTNLDNKEKQYREGIQLEIKKASQTFTWYLKDMKFGMNNK